jgi:hypothetical protein
MTTPNPKQDLDPEAISRLHWKEGISLNRLSSLYKVDSGYLHRWMRKNGMKVRNRQEAGLIRRQVKLSPSELAHLYVDRRLTSAQIGEMIGVSGQAIIWHLTKNGIRKRCRSECGRDHLRIRKPSLQEMYGLYVEQKLSSTRISTMLGVSSSLVRNWLHDYKIPVRDISEAVRKYPRDPFSGHISEKSYMAGFSLGDLYVFERSRTIIVNTTTTHPAMINLFCNLFERYGHCAVRPKKGTLGFEWTLLCSLDKSFDFLTTKVEYLDELDFFSFLAGYSDAEGCWMVRRSHENGVSILFELQTQDRETLQHIKTKLERYGYHPTFGIKRLSGSYANGNLTKDMIYLRILRRDEVISLIHDLMPHTRHQEKIDKMKLILAVGKGFSWSATKNRIDAFRTDIKIQVEVCKLFSQFEFQRMKEHDNGRNGKGRLQQAEVEGWTRKPLIDRAYPPATGQPM